MNLDSLFVVMQASGFAIACLAAMLGLTMRGRFHANRYLVAFFALIAASELSAITETVFGTDTPIVRDAFRAFSFTVTTAIGPALLFHVCVLTTREPWTPNRRTLAPHLMLTVATAFVCVAFLFLPEIDRTSAFRWSALAELPPISGLVGRGLAIMELLIYVQWMILSFVLVRCLAFHLRELKNHHATSEVTEMRWIGALTLPLGGYAALCLASQFLVMFGRQNPLNAIFDSLLVVIILLVVALWSLRPADTAASRPPQEVRLAAEVKYVKSALDGDRAAQIARKLDAAMRHDRLYREAGLSLGDLSRHVGVVPNYVSQTLNERLGLSFFDYLNSWRIDEALDLVDRGDQTILSIAYEVGFNSRSSFYTAFKARTGTTPTARRRMAGDLSPVSSSRFG